MASLPVMNLLQRAIFTVAAVFSYVILGQDFAEELRAIRPTRRRNIDLIRKVGGTPSIGAVKLTAGTSSLSLEVIAKSA